MPIGMAEGDGCSCSTCAHQLGAREFLIVIGTRTHVEHLAGSIGTTPDQV